MELAREQKWDGGCPQSQSLHLDVPVREGTDCCLCTHTTRWCKPPQLCKELTYPQHSIPASLSALCWCEPRYSSEVDSFNTQVKFTRQWKGVVNCLRKWTWLKPISFSFLSITVLMQINQLVWITIQHHRCLHKHWEMMGQRCEQDAGAGQQW